MLVGSVGTGSHPLNRRVFVTRKELRRHSLRFTTNMPLTREPNRGELYPADGHIVKPKKERPTVLDFGDSTG